LKARARKEQITEERRSSILKKYNEASNRLKLLKSSKEEKTKERQARYMARLESLQRIHVDYSQQKILENKPLLASPKTSSRLHRLSLPKSSSPVIPRSKANLYTKNDDRDVSPCRLRMQSDGHLEEKQCVMKDSYNERINRIKEIEKLQIKQLSSSLERRLERARLNAELKIQTRREKAREEVRHANDVYNKVKDTLASPSRSRVHVYASESSQREEGMNFNILLSTEEKLQRARELAELRLQARRQRAREMVQHAQDIARRVKAAKLIQRVVRVKILQLPDSSPTNVSQHPHVFAMKRLKRWDTWKYSLISNRLLSSKLDQEWKSCLNMDLTHLCVCEKRMRGKNIPTFERISDKLSDPTLLKITQNFLAVFSPVVHNVDVSVKHFLCAILLTTYPEEAIGSNVTDKMRKLLGKISISLITALKVMIDADFDKKREAVRAFVSSFLSFITVFGRWKHDDLQELISSLKLNAIESWVIYLTSVETLRYCSLKEQNMSPTRSSMKVQDEGLYQYKMRYDEAQKGSRDHIKRIRCLLNRLLGEQEGFDIMKDAKAVATKQLDEANSLQRLKNDVDDLCRTPLAEEHSASESSDVNALVIDDFISSITQNVSTSNVEFVHGILLMDQEDWISRSIRRNDEYCLSDCEAFFESWSVEVIATDIDERIRQTVEKAFFDKVYDDMQTEDLSSIQSLLTGLVSKITALVPNNMTYKHQFEHIHREVISSTSLLDLLMQLQTIGDLLSSLESPAQSPATNTWSSFTQSYLFQSSKTIPFHAKNVAEYILISTVYLLRKAELCHNEVIEFKISTAAPIIHQHGAAYERVEFQKSFASFTSLTSSELPATWTWITRLNDPVAVPAQYEPLLRERGFVDEILFTKQSLALPEVLYLDNQHIVTIRHVSKCSVILSALYLHGCNICGVRSNNVEPHHTSNEVNAYKKELSVLLSERKTPENVEKIETTMIKLIEGEIIEILIDI